MNRDMFYQNYNQSYSNPGMYVPPSGYNISTNYQSYGPSQNIAMPQMQYNNTQSFEDYINNKLDTIDRQIRNLDTRLQKIESLNLNKETDNVYMI